MNGETVLVSKMSGNDIHRVKRIKREDISARNHTMFRLSPTTRQSSSGVSRERLTRESSSSEVFREHNNANVRLDMDALAIQAAQAAIADSSSPRNAMSRCRTSSSARSQSQDLTVSSVRPHSLPSEIDVDLSSIPSDPNSLRIWIAQKIRTFQDNKSSLREFDSSAKHEESSNPFPVTLPNFDANLATRNTIEDETSQEETSGEKIDLDKNRRQTSKDRSMRGRRNKVFSNDYQLSGSMPTSALAKEGLIKQHTKRKPRQPIATHEKSSRSLFDPGLGRDLFSNKDPNLDEEVYHIGNLLKNALLTASDGTSRSNLEAATSLKVALENERVTSKSVVEALEIMAADPEILKNVTNFSTLVEEDEHVDTTSPANNVLHSPQGSDVATVAPTKGLLIGNHQSNERIRVLNAATALLNEMDDTKEYVTPYGNPPPRRGTTNGYGTHKSNGVDEPPSLDKAREAHNLDQHQIDALLALANGGSLTDDEDDKTIADPDEMNGPPLDQTDLAQADVDIIATLQRIINQLMAKRNNRHSSDDRQGFSPIGSVVEPYGSQSVRDQAALLQSLFSQAGVSINTIIPAAQSHATSQLYAHLSSRARSSTPSGGINPARASVYGYTANMNQRMLAKPGLFDPTAYLQGHPIQSLSMSSRANINIVPLRSKNPEEQKKIMSYGFPPLPGSRLGVKRQ